MAPVAVRAFVAVFQRWPYALLTVGVALLLLLTAAWLPNASFLWYVFTGSAFSLSTKFGLIGSSFSILMLNTTPLRFALTILLVILAGLNVSLLTYHLKQRIALGRAAGASVAGTLIGLVGVGCASCGSVILTSLIGWGATAGFLKFLPWRGAEFGLLGSTLLLISMWLTAKKITDPEACRV